MNQRLIKALLVAWTLIVGAGSSPAADCRVTTNEKGSLLIYADIELKWNADGTLAQDTFLSLGNDFSDAVSVQLFFINGDAPVSELLGPDGSVLREEEPGWNWADCRFTLTKEQPVFWSAARGNPEACQSFEVLDEGGRPDPEGPPGSRMLRGYAMAWAVRVGGEEIRWNHLFGHASIVDYTNSAAFDYEAHALQAKTGEHGLPPDDNPGQLILNGSEYDALYDVLYLPFYGVNSQALSSGPVNDPGTTVVTLDTDLTLVPVEIDLRRFAFDQVTTIAVFEVFNENEVKLSGSNRRITCWDQILLSLFPGANNFTRQILGTDRGFARINGVASTRCATFAMPAAMIGVAKKVVGFSGNVERFEYSGVPLAGGGCEDASIIYDLDGPVDDPNSDEAIAERTNPRPIARTPVTKQWQGSGSGRSAVMRPGN